MPLVKDGSGKEIWCDEPGRGSVALRTCSRTANDRMTLGCEPRRRIGRDEALIDADTGGDLIDSAQARRIVEAVMKKLDKADLTAVIDMLVDAEKMTKEEARNVERALDPSPSPRAMDARPIPSKPKVTAADAWARRGESPVFPHAGRLAR